MLIESLKAAPTHLAFRTKVHAILHVPIPDDKVTYNQIRDWIECEWEESVPPKPEYVRFHCCYQFSETGHCRYRVVKYGEGNYNLPLDKLCKLLDTALSGGYTMANFWSIVNDEMSAIVTDNVPEMEMDMDTMHTDRYDPNDREDNEFDYELWTELKPKILELLRKHRPVDLGHLEAGTAPRPQPPPPPPDNPDDDGGILEDAEDEDPEGEEDDDP
jgi:hypothetical protein